LTRSADSARLRLRERLWTPPAPGTYHLSCRAIDAAGEVQPEEQQLDCESYAANWVVPVEVTVMAEEHGSDDFVI
jgi:hypothetical protein